MTIVQGVALFFAAIAAGAINSVAGGGSFISFPTLLFVGVPPIQANATNSAAVWPGSIASIAPYRADLAHERRELILFSVISGIGGILGALILSKTPSPLFEKMIPLLLLVATIIFATGGKLTSGLRRLRRSSPKGADLADAATSAEDALPREAAQPTDVKSGDAANQPSLGALIAVLGIQFVISLYGGFFGGGIGIMMLAGFALLGMANIHAMNALKAVLSSVINGVAVITFALLHVIFWPQAILMAVGAVIGGYGGATLAHYVPAAAIRWFVIAIGFALSIYFFGKFIIFAAS